MNSKQIETLKFAGGALIVGAAALIMFPGFLAMLAGLGRIFLIIAIAGSAALALAYTTHFIRKRRGGAPAPSVVAEKTSTES